MTSDSNGKPVAYSHCWHTAPAPGTDIDDPVRTKQETCCWCGLTVQKHYAIKPPEIVTHGRYKYGEPNNSAGAQPIKRSSDSTGVKDAKGLPPPAV